MTAIKYIALGLGVAIGLVAVYAAGYRGMQVMVRDAIIEAHAMMREAGE